MASKRCRKQRTYADLVLLTSACPDQRHRDARRIRRVSPNSQIIFLSQHDSLQMVKDALNTGGTDMLQKAMLDQNC